MGRILPIVLAVIASALAAGFVYLGALPPDPPMREIQRTVPSDRFQNR